MTLRLGQLLICDDDQLIHLSIKAALKDGWQVHSVYHSDEALAILVRHTISVLLLDIQMRTPDEGMKLLKHLKETQPDLPIIILSGKTDLPTVREAIRMGAFDYLSKDFDPTDLNHTLMRATERSELLKRKEQQNFETKGAQRRHTLIGESGAIQAVKKFIEQFKKSSANILITGQTGTGKEVVARQLRGKFPDGTLAPFIAIDSSTIQSSTAESQLFGHEKGAFTGADRTRKGVFEEADGGIVFFDEIGNMPLEIQAKLLRVIQEKEITRLGSTRAIPTDFRVVCATNLDLEKRVHDGLFKEDLLQRISVLPITVPPLCERTEDIPLLARYFLDLESRGRPFIFADDALEMLKNYPWPGNTRELQNTILWIVATLDGNEINPPDLPPRLRDHSLKQGTHSSSLDFYSRVADFEKKILADEFLKSDGNISQLAITLGMDRSHLHAKLRHFGIKRKP